MGADKRFANDLRTGPLPADVKNDKYTCVEAACDNASGMQIGGAGDILRWPNAGAFAGFYSFVTCANADSTAAYNVANAYKYVFHVGGAPASDCEMTGTAITGSADPVVLQGCMIPRAVVVSLANDDFRVEDCVTANRRLTARWNVRQAGINIGNCGPGTLPDGDAGRCSWNWNFNTFTANSVLQDEAEAFFERSSPRSFEPWQSGAEVGRFAQEGSPTDPITNVVITSVLKDAAGGDLAGSIALDVPSVYVTVGETLDAEPQDNTVLLSNVMLHPVMAPEIPSQTATKEKKSIMSGHVDQTTAHRLLVSTHGPPQCQQPSPR